MRLDLKKQSFNDLASALDGAITDAEEYFSGPYTEPEDLVDYKAKVERWKVLHGKITTALANA